MHSEEMESFKSNNTTVVSNTLTGDKQVTDRFDSVSHFFYPLIQRYFLYQRLGVQVRTRLGIILFEVTVRFHQVARLQGDDL